MTGAKMRGARPSIRLHLIIGLAVVLVPPYWQGSAAGHPRPRSSGALIAPGSIVVESNVKKVQHPTGGVVGEVHAHDGDVVKANDVVVRLDDTVTKASLAIVAKSLDGLWARAGRLEAEQQGLDRIVFPPMLTSIGPTIPMSKNVMANESKLFEFRTTGRIGQSPPVAPARRAVERGDRYRPAGAGEGAKTRKSRWWKRNWSGFKARSTISIWCR